MEIFAILDLMYNMESKIIIFEGNQEQGIFSKARKFYDERKEYFKTIEKVVYEVTTSEGTVVEEADRNQLNFLGKSDSALADFLLEGSRKESYHDIQGNGERKVVIKEITYSEEGFEKNKEAAMVSYINQELYPMLIQMVADNNPVSYRFNIEE